MEKLLSWIIKHKTTTIIVIVLLFVTPLIFIHFLFMFKTDNPLLAAKWTPGDLMAYIAGFEAFAGTLFLGMVSIHQNENAQIISKQLSEENNLIQKIAAQNNLPLIKISLKKVSDAEAVTSGPGFSEDILVLNEAVSPEQREPQLIIHTGSIHHDELLCKEMLIEMENISETCIRQIAFDKVQFNPFRLCKENVTVPACYGDDKYKYLNLLLFPHDTIEVLCKIYFADLRYKRFWEHHSDYDIGCFAFDLSLTNKSIANIEFRENVYFDIRYGFKEKIVHRPNVEDDHYA